MRVDIKIGSVVHHLADGATNVSIVRRISPDGLYVYIDYMEGKDMRSYRESPVLMSIVKLL